MRLYVGTYGKYAAGSIEGAWLDLNDYSDKEEFLEACRELHADETDPEFMFQDCECDNDLEEKFYCESFISEDYWEYKEAVEDCGIEANAIAEYISYHGYDILEGIKNALDCYLGTWESEEAFAEFEVTEGQYLENLPSWISCHIDWEGIARELSYDYNFCQTTDGVAVFCSR